MNSKTVSRANKILLVVLGVLALMLVVVFSVKSARKTRLVKNELSKRQTISDSRFSFKEYTNSRYEETLKDANEEIDDLIRITEEDYRKLHISMWDIDYLNPEWFDTYYASKILYSNHEIRTPQELCNYISTATKANEEIDTIYMGIDPYELYKNYYTRVYYDSEILTFEEYIENNLFPIFDENKNINFRIFLPIRPLSEWAKEADATISQTLKNWYTFLMYLRLYPNVKTVYMGNEEWLVCNDTCFKSDYSLNDEMGQLVHLYMYTKDDYAITPPELDDALGVLQGMVCKARNGDYHIGELEEERIVYFGDLILNYTNQECLTIPGYVECLTGAKYYNYSVGGATAADIGVNSFIHAVQRFCNGEAPENKIEENFKKLDEDDKAIIIIEFGATDFLKGINEDDYASGLKSGIEILKDRYPNSKIILVAPYQIGVEKDGRPASIQDGKAYSNYVLNVEKVATEEDVLFLNLYEKAGINLENYKDFLVDGIHPNYSTSLYLARILAEYIREISE